MYKEFFIILISIQCLTFALPTPGAGIGKNGIADLMQDIAKFVPTEYRNFIPGYIPPNKGKKEKQTGAGTTIKKQKDIGAITDQFAKDLLTVIMA